MILSNVEIQSALDDGRLRIHPEPQPRQRIPGKNCPYDTHSVDLTLGPDISIPKPGRFAFDPSRQEDLADLLTKISDKRVLTPDTPFVLEQSQFILGNTAEKVHLPIPGDAEICLEPVS